MRKKIRVLVVDDSSLVRNILEKGLSADPDIEVVGVAPDPYIARDKIVQLSPDVLTLDVEMPRMDGVEFLRRLMPQYPLPVVMVSALTQKGKRITIEALEAGAVDFVTKPSTDVARGLSAMLDDLREKVKAASKANVSSWRKAERARQPGVISGTRALAESTDKVIAIGASTGGTEAIKRVLARFPRNTPGVVIVQHMPAGFTRTFAERLNAQCAMEVSEAADGERVLAGKALVAPGDRHMMVERSGGIYRVRVKDGEKVSGHRPSVDMLMGSLAKSAGPNAVGVILTGMGADGAQGLLAMRRAGARTIAQDKDSCIVFGMPKVAHDVGGAERLLPLDAIAQEVIKLISAPAGTPGRRG
ncbi:MAG: protein-glutamate methylesterase/protein-glutamine glutaminase [Candidatus Nitrospinota bacterium M3_3B_026]